MWGETDRKGPDRDGNSLPVRLQRNCGGRLTGSLSDRFVCWPRSHSGWPRSHSWEEQSGGWSCPIARRSATPSDPASVGCWTSALQQESEWAPRAIGLSMVLLGVLGSTLVTAIVVTAFQEALERVRNGRTEVRGRPKP